MLTVHTNGTCGSGSGGFAGIIEMDGQEMLMFTGGDPHTNNQRMELSAVIEAFRMLNESPDMSRRAVTIRSNSRYVVDAFTRKQIKGWQQNGWQTQDGNKIPNWDLWSRLLEAIDKYVVTWQLVQNRDASVWSKRCTALAINEAAHALKVGKYWVNKGVPLSIQAPEETPEMTMVRRLPHLTARGACGII